MHIVKKGDVALLDYNLIEDNDVSSTQRAFLHSLNSNLAEIEVEIKSEFERQIKISDARISAPDDWVTDCETICYISFILNENDPAFNDEEDNILGQWFDSGLYGLADGINHNEIQPWRPEMNKEHHCWLYHCLYDHTELGWSNILRIGSIWVDFNIEYQKIIDINSPINLHQ